MRRIYSGTGVWAGQASWQSTTRWKYSGSLISVGFKVISRSMLFIYAVKPRHSAIWSALRWGILNHILGINTVNVGKKSLKFNGLYIICGPQDLSGKLNCVGSMNLGTGNTLTVSQTPQQVHGSLKNVFQKKVDFVRRLHDRFEHSLYPIPTPQNKHSRNKFINLC